MHYVIRMTYLALVSHPDELRQIHCHPDDILFHFMSSGWLNWGWFLIRMSYGNVIMSSGWDTLPFLSDPDEIANFDFPQHAVALQRFRKRAPYLLFVGHAWGAYQLCDIHLLCVFNQYQQRMISHITRLSVWYQTKMDDTQCWYHNRHWTPWYLETWTVNHSYHIEII